MENIKKKYKSIERGALIRGIKFEIKLSEYTNYYGKPCHYCGTPAIGLDRIDSALNYTKNNVVTCCHTCNMMKSTLEADAFVLHCSRIALHNNIESKLPEYVEAEENYSDLTFSDAKKIMIENFERDFIQRKLTEYKTIENAKKAIVIAFGSNVRASVIFNLRTDGMPAQNEDDIKIIKAKS